MSKKNNESRLFEHQQQLANNDALNNSDLQTLSPVGLDVKSYRKLELIHSPAAPCNNQMLPNDSEIKTNSKNTGSLMGLIKAEPKQQNFSIKWPQDAIPQRVKQLTWDDELSLEGGGATPTNNCAATNINEEYQLNLNVNSCLVNLTSPTCFDNNNTSPSLCNDQQHQQSYNQHVFKRGGDGGGTHCDAMPPPMCHMGPYGPLASGSADAQHMEQQYQNSLNQQAGSSTNSCSFLFSAPNSPSHLNRWLDHTTRAAAETTAASGGANQHHQMTLMSEQQAANAKSYLNINNNHQHHLHHQMMNPTTTTSVDGELLMAPTSQMLVESTPSICCDGQDNCFDYTIVQSSQFHVDSFMNSMHLNNNNQKQNQLHHQNFHQAPSINHHHQNQHHLQYKPLNNVLHNHHANNHNHERPMPLTIAN